MYKYFLYSLKQIADKNEMYDKVNKEMVLGTVIYNGKRREFSALSDTKTLERYSDARVVAEGEIDKMQYTMPSSKQKRMI